MDVRKILSGAQQARAVAPSNNRRRKLKRKFPLCIEALAVTCGGELVHELRPFVRQFKFYHPEWPMHIATDLEGYESINDLIGPDDKVWLISQSTLKELALKSNQKDHGHRWSKGWIGVKLENFRRAVEDRKCGVLQCDSDLILSRSLPRVNWNADIVMSTHCGPLCHQDVPMFHGYYNAGLLLTDQTWAVEKWIELYNSGHGGFYEQKLLETFSEKYVVSLFPDDWNWGPWRHHENIKFNGRMPAMLHAHTDGRFRQDTPLHDLAGKVLLRNEAAYRSKHSKLAFCHCAKAAGSEVARLLHEVIAPELNYQVLNSFAIRDTDWNEQELKDLCNGVHQYQEGNRWIVHNHNQGWSQKSIDRFLSEDWLFFAFHRPIRERLCSFYFWAINTLQRTGHHPMLGPITQTKTMSEFLKMLVTDERYVAEWRLPNNHRDMLWFDATNEGIVKWAKDVFNLTLSYESLQKTNSSTNPGWDYCVTKSMISDEVLDIINNDMNVFDWDGKAKGKI